MALADFLIPMTIFAFLWTGVNDSKIRKLQRETPSQFHHHEYDSHIHSDPNDPDINDYIQWTSKPGGYDHTIHETSRDIAGVRGWY